MENGAIEAGVKALVGLLGEFEKGNINDPSAERAGIDRHTSELSARWERRFAGFPDEYFPFTSFRGEYYRGKRDAYLKKIIAQLVTSRGAGNRTIVNAACVFGRHTRDLASRLPSFRVIGTDIFPFWNRIYTLVPWRRTPDNFEFIQDNIFDPRLDVTPTAVVFFGACGSVSDGAMDYAIHSQARFLACRTCCHDNIGGNMEVVRRPGFINWFFRWKNRSFARMRRKEKYTDFYFSDRYGPDRYPKSEAARGVLDSEKLLEVSRNSVDSDICRAIIDLDRYLHLIESGYDVVYKGELFVAQRGKAVAEDKN